VLSSASLEHLVLHVQHELLLLAEDAPRPAYPVPANESSRGKMVALHRVEANKRASPTESCFAVNSDGGRFCLGDMQELLDDVWWRAAAVLEVQVNMFDAIVNKAAPLVQLSVQAYNEPDTRIPENGHVVLWRELVLLGVLCRATQ